MITAPSGAGKTTLISRFLDRHPETGFSVSHTTRSPRKKERDGVDYFFVNEKKFQMMIEKGEFLEWARVHDHYYGTSLKQIHQLLERKEKAILDIDVQGSLQLQRSVEALFIFIGIRAPHILEERLRQRGTESNESIRKRLERAREELSFQNRWKYVIINKSIDQSLFELERILYPS